MYFLTEPNSFSSFRNSPALWIVARIFFSLRTIPALPINAFTSLSLNLATLGRENCSKAFWKSGHLFSTTVQLSPAVNTDLVSLSKYSASSFGGFILRGDMLSQRGFADIYAPRFSLVKPGLLDTLGATYLVAAYYQVYNQGALLASIDGYHEREPPWIRRARAI